MQKAALKTRLGIPIIISTASTPCTEATSTTTPCIFPHNIKLGATKDPIS